MSAVARIGDSAAVVHRTCSPITRAATGSPNVFINGIPCHRVGDVNAPHTTSPPYCIPHVTPLIRGSSSVFVNGRSMARVTDVYACRARLITGSPNVFAGDAGSQKSIVEGLAAGALSFAASVVVGKAIGI